MPWGPGRLDDRVFAGLTAKVFARPLGRLVAAHRAKQAPARRIPLSTLRTPDLCLPPTLAEGT